MGARSHMGRRFLGERWRGFLGERREPSAPAWRFLDEFSRGEASRHEYAAELERFATRRLVEELFARGAAPVVDIT